MEIVPEEEREQLAFGVAPQVGHHAGY
jgi:hypothetical protein